MTLAVLFPWQIAFPISFSTTRDVFILPVFWSGAKFTRAASSGARISFLG